MARPKTEASTYVRVAYRLPVEVVRALHQRALLSEKPLNTVVIQALRRGLKLRAGQAVPEPDTSPSNQRA